MGRNLGKQCTRPVTEFDIVDLKAFEITDATQIVSIGTGRHHSVVATVANKLFSSGNFENLGRNSFIDPSVFKPILVLEQYLKQKPPNSFKQLLIGETRTFFLLADGNFFSYWNDERGQDVTDFPYTTLGEKIIALSASKRDLVLALTESQKVYSMGSQNEFGQLGTGKFCFFFAL